MSQFSRRARWLNDLFPQSVAPTVTDPAQRSDDVSLTAPYDGGGYGFANAAQLVTNTGILPAAASGGSVIITTAEDEIYRLMAGSVIKHAGNNALVWLIVIDNGGAGDSCGISEAFNTTGTGFNQTMPMSQALTVGPSMTITVQWVNGDVLTALSFQVYGFRAPLGTAFQC